MVLYYLGLAFLFTHELDAVTHSEWRLLPILSGMPDSSAGPLFVALHVLLFFGILWLSHHPREPLRRWARWVVAGFLVVHAILHFALSSSPEYGFHGVLSETLIVSASVCGLAFLIVNWRSGHEAPKLEPPNETTRP